MVPNCLGRPTARIAVSMVLISSPGRSYTLYPHGVYLNAYLWRARGGDFITSAEGFGRIAVDLVAIAAGSEPDDLADGGGDLSEPCVAVLRAACCADGHAVA